MTTDPTPEQVAAEALPLISYYYKRPEAAQRVLRALSAAGFRVVPAEPSYEMVDAAAAVIVEWGQEVGTNRHPLPPFAVTRRAVCAALACRPDREET